MIMIFKLLIKIVLIIIIIIDIFIANISTTQSSKSERIWVFPFNLEVRSFGFNIDSDQIHDSCDRHGKL